MKQSSIQLRNGGRLGYAESGDPAGEVLFFHHGWPGCRLQGGLLGCEGLRVIAPDRPGIGLSDFQPGRRLGDWPETLMELADQLGVERFHLLGWSGGGPYVLATCAALPQRVLSATVVCGAPPLMELGAGRLFWPYRLLLWLYRRAPSLLAAVLAAGAGQAARAEPGRPPVSWLLRRLCEADQRVLMDPEVFRNMRESLQESLRNGPAGMIADAEVYLQTWDLDWAAIMPLVHFWHGRADRNIDWTYSVEMAQRLPRVRTHWLDDEGHYSLLIARHEVILREALQKSADP